MSTVLCYIQYLLVVHNYLERIWQKNHNNFLQFLDFTQSTIIQHNIAWHKKEIFFLEE